MRPPGAPGEPSGAISHFLMNLLKIVKSCQCHFDASWMQFVVLLKVLQAFLKSQNEGYFEPC